MLKKSLFYLMIIACLLGQQSFGQEPENDIKELARKFAQSAVYSRPTLSPSGRFLAVIESIKETKVVVFDLEDPHDPQRVITAFAHLDPADKEGDEDIPIAADRYLSLNWLDDQKLVMRFIHKFVAYNCDEVYRCARYGRPRQRILDIKERQLKEMPTTPGKVGRTVVWPSENTQSWMLVSALSLYEVDKKSLNTKEIKEFHWLVDDIVLDREEEVRMLLKSGKTTKPHFTYRLSGQKKWRHLKEAKLEAGKDFSIFGFAENLNHIYVASNHESSPSGLYLFDLESRQFIKKLGQHPRYDISGVAINSSGGVDSILAGDEIIFQTEKSARLQKLLIDEAGLNRVSFYGRNYEDTRRVYGLSSPSSAGEFYLVDNIGTQDERILHLFSRRSVELSRFTKLQSKEITTPDGLTLEAFLSFPSAYDEVAKQPVPFVVMPHGGPWARDFAEFDELSQFVNALGIGVIKINFRGSEGYGADFAELGVGEWGKAMQDDLNTARDYLITNGYSSPESICMVGWSYGGFASLMAAIRDGDKYKCVASIAGVTDLSAILRSRPSDEVLRRIGARSMYDHGAVREISPIEKVEQISIPVFLAHGTSDAIVPYEEHYVPILKEMQKLSKDVSFVAFKWGDHSLSGTHDRQVLYERLGLFLDEQLKP